MPVVSHKQHRPVSDSEVAEGAGLSVRQLFDIAESLNNFAVWCSNNKAIQLFSPQQSGARVQSHLGTTEERVIGVYAPVYYPDGPTRFVCRAGVRRVAGAGTITWRVYCSGAFYNGPVVMDTARLSADYSSTSIVCDDDAHGRPVTRDLKLVRMGNEYEPYSWMVLTAENGDAATQGILTTLDVWPEWHWAIDGVVVML